MKRARTHGQRLKAREAGGRAIRAQDAYNRWRRADPSHKAAGDFYGSATWKAIRAAHRRREPLCRRCRKMGRVEAATLVDHIVPVRVDPSRSRDPENLQSLCSACHAIKTAQERGGAT